MDTHMIVFVFFTVFTNLVFGFEVSGTITMENATDDMVAAKAGDHVHFSFDIQIDIDTDNHILLVTIAGDTLEFYNQTYVDNMDWALTDSTGLVSYSRNSSELEAEESIISPLNNKGGLAYFLNITGQTGAGQWSFNGSYEMKIKDDITLGSLIRSVMTVNIHWYTNNTSFASTRTLASNYYVIPHQNVTAEAKSNLSQPIMGLFTSHVIIHSSRDVRNYLVQCYTSPEEVSKEVRLTVQQMRVAINDTFGTTPTKLNQLKYVKDFKTSTLGSYQNNAANLRLPPIPLDTDNFAELTVTSEFTVRVEDYSELEDGDQWPVYMGTSFSCNIVWAGWIDVNITAPVVSVPALSVDLQQMTQCSYDGSTTKKVKVVVSHTPESTGTAYNVTVNLYLPSYMEMIWRTFTQPLENTITVSQDGTVITSEITRLTFSDPYKLEVTLAVDLSDLQVLQASNRIITAEALCNDRWGLKTDIMSNTMYLSLQVDEVCFKRLTWTSSSTCTCLHDSLRSDCGCCENGACQCGAVRPDACAPCDQMWRCVQYKTGFEKLSYLSSKNIRCDAFYRRRGSATGVSCHKQLSSNPGKYLELSPRVAVVTGRSLSTGYLYGIGNNGRVYVKSEDDGSTWGSIMDEEYLNVTSDSQFKWATFT